MIIAKNMPMARDSAMEWADRSDADAGRTETPSDSLLDWIAPFGRASGNWRRVALGAIVGALVSACIVLRDVFLINAKPGWLLPFHNARAPILLQAVFVVVAWTVWGAAFGGIMTSTVYRRALLTSVSVTVFIATCIGFAVALPRNDLTVGLTLGAATFAAAITLLMALPMDLEIAQRQTRHGDVLSEQAGRRHCGFERRRQSGKSHRSVCPLTLSYVEILPNCGGMLRPQRRASACN